MIKNSFLDAIDTVNSNIYEFQLLTNFKKQNREKILVLKLENLTNIAECLSSLKEYLRLNYKKSEICLYEWKSDGVNGSISHRVVSEQEYYNETAFINESAKLSNDGYSYILTNDKCLLYDHGKISEEFDQQYFDSERITEAYQRKYDIYRLDKVFELYQVEKKHEESDEIFKDGLIDRTKISEQWLRNDLYTFLDNNLKGITHIEYCTSKKSDEESVDIVYIDPNEDKHCVIEVKFFIEGQFFFGSKRKKYDEAKILAGLEQLNRYCIHLHEMGKEAYRSYLYVFCASGKSSDELIKIAEEYYNSYNDKSEFLISTFSRTILNYLNEWKKPIRIA